LQVITLVITFGFGIGGLTTNSLNAQVELDINGDGTLNILILGTNSSINGTETFSPNQISEELQNILSTNENLSIDVNVIAEDIHMSSLITVGLGGAGTEYNWTHHSHSLVQYYYWPEGYEDRIENLSGHGENDWDYVIIGADPYIVSIAPGYYSLGVNKIAAKVVEGGAQALLLMMWPKNETSGTSINHFEEFTYRTSDGAKVPITTIPVGLAWNALPNEKKDFSNQNPTPNGAYLAAASIFSQISNENANSSNYIYDDELADIAMMTVLEQENQIHYSGIRNFISPYKSCDISDDVLNYNHTGTSSENGILAGLNWVFNQAPEMLQNGGTSPINFNYGRANINFEANKRYQVNPDLFDFSFGFPMQDHGNHGDVSMLYGIDKRDSGVLNDTDLGVSQFMVQQGELPYARAIPVRTLFAQMREAIPGQSAYRDSWHMHRDLDKAIASFMFTTLNGTCNVDDEPADQNSDQWRTWMSHKIGFETAWNLMYLEGSAPDCSILLDEDGDGFNSVIDCDDNNEQINPNQMEVIYNGIDDDCNPATLDDDLDQDGFLSLEDCDDENANINPEAEEIPNNGIDEDCDGEDLINSVYELVKSTINIYPNPTSELIHIEVSGAINYLTSLYDSYGRLIQKSLNNDQIKIDFLPPGNYILQIIDLESGQKISERIVVGR
jgi:hypothetical protein